MAMAIHGRSSERASFEVFLCFSKSQPASPVSEGERAISQERGIEEQGRLGFRLSAFSYLPPFDEVRDHHNGADALLPDHAPEGVEGVGERALRGHVCPRLLEAVDEVGIEVLATLLARKGAKLDARVIV